MIEDFAVRKIKEMRLEYVDRHYIAPEYLCERCGFKTRRMTTAYVHAKVTHGDPPPAA